MATTRKASFITPTMLAIFLLGFASGLPLALTGGTLSVWLTETGIDRTTIGLLASVATPYALKFLWAPLVDGLPLPWFCHRFGKRRGWLIAVQLCLFLAMLLLGSTSPTEAIWLTAAGAFAVAVLSATQDIVIDAYRVELLEPEEQANGAAAIQFGYRMGMLASGGGALMLATHYDWQTTYSVMALILLVGSLTALIIGEPKHTLAFPQRDTTTPLAKRMAHWAAESVVDPFRDFLSRSGAWWILLFVVLFKLGDAFLGIMANPFYLDMGFTKPEIATIVKTGGLVATLLGTFAGGWLTLRLGTIKALWIGAITQLATNALYILQAQAGHDIPLLWVTISADNFFGGLGAAVFVGFLSQLCNARFTATQYALLSSLAAIGRTFLSTSAGALSEMVSWSEFFALSMLVGLPGVLMIAKIARIRPV